MPKILIVDDSATIRKMVRASLRRWTTRSSSRRRNGLEAIEQIALGAGVPSSILDLNMPDMHGMDVLKFVRRHQALPRRAGRRADDARRRVEPRDARWRPAPRSI